MSELNRGIADERGLWLELVRWETHTWPGRGHDAQDVINQQLPRPDIVIGIFWRRLGTPTARAASGTAEELELALTRWRDSTDLPIMVYFNRAPYSPDASDVDQLPRLAAFRSQLEHAGLLVWDYRGPDEFETQVRQHLTQVLRNWRAGANGTAIPTPSVTAQARARTDQLYEQLRTGQLETELDARRRGEVHSLAAVVETALCDEGFGRLAVGRASAALTELIINVGRHTPSGLARLAITWERRFGRRIAITVHDQGREFDLNGILHKHYAGVAKGGREHGLMQVSRNASHLIEEPGQAPWTHRVELDVYDVEEPLSPLLDYPRILRLGIDYAQPEVYWLGRDYYVGEGLLEALRFGVESDSRDILHLCFGRMAQRSADYLGLDLSGPPEDRTPTTDQVWLDDESKPSIFVRAAQAYFPSYFSEGRVIVLIRGEPKLPDVPLARWIADRTAKVVYGDDKTAARRSLSEILAASG